MHVHVTLTSDLAAPIMVALGVTSTHDMGRNLAIVDWRRERLNTGAIRGPRLSDRDRSWTVVKLARQIAGSQYCGGRLAHSRGLRSVVTMLPTSCQIIDEGFKL